MSKLGLAEQFFGCVQRGWKLFGRSSDGMLAFAQKEYKIANGAIHKQRHIENGWRFLEDSRGNTIMRRSPEGAVIKFDNNTGKTLTWTKNSEGKYCWT